MKAILQILLIIICGAGIFYSMQTKNKFQEQKDQVEATQRDNTQLGADIKEASIELSNEKAGLEAANKDFDEQQATLEAAQSTQKQIERQISQAEATLSEQDEALKSQDKLLEETKNAVAEALNIPKEEVTLDNIAPKIEELQTNKKDLTKKMEELSTVIGSAEKDVSRNKTNIADLSSRKARRDERIRSNAKEAVISDVNGDWGFVVIDAGSNVGFTPQTRLLVMRGNKLVGRVKPQAISPTQTVADIDLDSIAPGNTLQSGDQVIMEKPARD